MGSFCPMTAAFASGDARRAFSAEINIRAGRWTTRRANANFAGHTYSCCNSNAFINNRLTLDLSLRDTANGQLRSAEVAFGRHETSPKTQTLGASAAFTLLLTAHATLIRWILCSRKPPLKR